MDQTLSPLLKFKDQFTFSPSVINAETITSYSQIVVCGMGGSAISVSLLKLLFPELPITLHNSYGLPIIYDKEKTLFILNSYSGDTEEVLDTFSRAKKEGLTLAALSKGGQLLTEIKAFGGAYVELPEISLEPRFAIGHQMVGILSILGENDKIKALLRTVELLNIRKAQEQGESLAKTFADKYPVLYTSSNFYPVAYLIKAAINEGAKIPSFVNQIPEANHNELQSFVTDNVSSEKDHFGFLFITSAFDHVRILKRCTVMKTLYEERGFTTFTLPSNHTDMLSIFETLLTGYFMATYMALAKNIDPYTTPLIALFKKKLAEK